MPFATKAEVMKLSHRFDNEEVGLMLMKLNKHQLSEAADTRARALLMYAGELAWQNSINTTRFVTLMLMLAFGAWFARDAYGSLAELESLWRILGTAVAAGVGLAFGYFISGVVHFLYGKFVLGVD